MKVHKTTKRNGKLLTQFVQKIYTRYKLLAEVYTEQVVNNVNDNRLDFILNFINTWTREVMDIANDYDIIRNIVNLNNDISVHKNGKYTIAIEIFDNIPSVIDCKEFGSILSIYQDNTIIAAGILRYSYIVQLVLTINGSTQLYNFSKDNFIKAPDITTPTIGDTYFITDGKNISYNDYGTYQFVDKLKSTHTLAFSKSIVSNLFHILVNGGVFLSAAEDSGNTDIKLLFHAVPLAYIAENCGLICYSGNVRTLETEYPTGKRGLKLTTRLIIGSAEEMDKYTDIINPSLVFFD